MKRSFKNVLIILLVVLMILGILMPIFAETTPPFSDETYYNNLCSGMGYNENKETCESFKSYLRDKIKESNNSLANVEIKIENIRQDINKYTAEVQEYKNQIIDLENSAVEIQSSIVASENEIIRLEALITERVLTIEEKEARIKDYIALSQSQSRVNGYIEFVMGAQDFSEIIMRMEGLNRIKIFNETLIAELRAERAALEEDKANVESQKQYLVGEKELLEEQIIYTQSLETARNNLLASLHVLEDEAQAAADNINAKVAADAAIIESLKEVIVSTSGWTRPVAGGYRITEGVWSYSFGGGHMGVDLGVNTGTAVQAAGNGIVASTRGGCSTNGSWSCNGSYGNYVNIIIDVDGTMYGVLYAHLEAGSFNVSANQRINAGDVLARSGNSGASTGPHLHVEVILLPGSNIQEAWNAWGGSPNFNTGSASSGGQRCDMGYGAPCRLNPLSIFGYTVGGSH